MSPAGRTGDARGSGLLEVMAVALLAVATVGSAWCAYQASQWNGEQTRLGRVSSDSRVEASRLFSLATQTVSYDTNVIGLYSQAIATKNTDLARFYRETLVRKDFLPILDRWEAAIAKGELPPGLLEDDAYLAERLAGYDEAIAQAEMAAVESEEAGQTSNDYILGALIIAVSLFFAGVTPTFKLRGVRLLLLAGSGLTLAYAASRISDLGVLGRIGLRRSSVIRLDGKVAVITGGAHGHGAAATALPVMKAQRRGSIINTSSVGGLGGSSPCYAYGATKWALRGTRSTCA